MQGDIGFVGPDLRPGNDPSFVPNYGELKEGAEIMAITFPSPAPDMQFDRHNFTLVFAVHHGPKDQFAPEYTHRSGLPGLLGLLTDEVATVIDLVTVKAC